MALGGERRARPDVSLFERLGPRRPLTRHHRSAGRGGPRRRRARERRAAEVGVVVLEVASSSSAAKGVGSSVLGSSRGGLKRGAPRAVGDVSRVGVDRRGAGDVLFWGRERARERERERERERKRKRERKRGKEVEVQNEKRRGKKVSFFFRSGEIPLSKGDPPSFLVDARREPRALARRRRRGGHRKLRREKKNKRELTFLGRRRSSVRSLSRFRSFAPLPTTRGFGITLAPSLADVFGVQIAPAELYFTPEIKATEGEEPTGSEMARWALASCCCDAELPRAPAPPPASASLSPPPPPVTRRASAAFISIFKKRSSLGAEKKEVSRRRAKGEREAFEKEPPRDREERIQCCEDSAF